MSWKIVPHPSRVCAMGTEVRLLTNVSRTLKSDQREDGKGVGVCKPAFLSDPFETGDVPPPGTVICSHEMLLWTDVQFGR